MNEKSANQGYIQITRRCNNKCIICSNPSVEDELSIEEIKKQILHFIGKGANLIYFTGGEPTTNESLPAAIEFCKEKGIECSIITNGINLADREYCMSLKKAGLANVNFSLYSHIKGTLNKLTGGDNSSKIMGGLKNCNEIISNLTINLVISSLNYKELPKTAEFISKNFPKIKHFSINFIDFTGRARERKEVIPKFSEIEIYLYKLIRALQKEGKTFRVERVPLCYMGGFEEFSTETIRLVLNQGYHALYLNENPIGRRERNLEGKEMIKYDSRKQDKSVCRFCSLKNICLGVCEHYLEVHGFSDIYPVFGKGLKENIIKKIKQL